jgi:hypothetical protein
MIPRFRRIIGLIRGFAREWARGGCTFTRAAAGCARS